jgi:DNA-binding NarL/FixJ family response regulator
MIRVILCDDHAVVRRGIKDTLSEAVDIQVVAEAGSYAEVREALRQTPSTPPCAWLEPDNSLPESSNTLTACGLISGTLEATK